MEVVGKELIHQICEVDRMILSMIDKQNLVGIESERLPNIMRKEDDPNGFVAMVQWTKHLATKLKKQLDNALTSEEIRERLNNPKNQFPS